MKRYSPNWNLPINGPQVSLKSNAPPVCRLVLMLLEGGVGGQERSELLRVTF